MLHSPSERRADTRRIIRVLGVRGQRCRSPTLTRRERPRAQGSVTQGDPRCVGRVCRRHMIRGEERNEDRRRYRPWNRPVAPTEELTDRTSRWLQFEAVGQGVVAHRPHQERVPGGGCASERTQAVVERGCAVRAVDVPWRQRSTTGSRCPTGSARQRRFARRAPSRAGDDGAASTATA